MDKRTEILDAAERRARLGGYSGFSFREVAADVGIKSASVHYHFPTKEELGEALADRYIDSALKTLGDPHGLSPHEGFDRVASLFLRSHEVDDLMCLCGIFGAEAASIPDVVRIPVDRFFDELVSWLSQTLVGSKPEPQARALVAALEGALIIARTGRAPTALREVISTLREQLDH